MMNEELFSMYQNMGIDKTVFEYCQNAEAGLQERFQKIDGIAEYNQAKVLHAMQKQDRKSVV